MPPPVGRNNSDMTDVDRMDDIPDAGASHGGWSGDLEPVAYVSPKHADSTLRHEVRPSGALDTSDQLPSVAPG